MGYPDMSSDRMILENGVLRPLTAEEVAEVDARNAKFAMDLPAILASEARNERDGKLKDTDWSQLPDVPEVIRNAYTVYRQALRDVPEQEGFPSDIIWPTKPE